MLEHNQPQPQFNLDRKWHGAFKNVYNTVRATDQKDWWASGIMVCRVTKNGCFPLIVETHDHGQTYIMGTRSMYLLYVDCSTHGTRPLGIFSSHVLSHYRMHSRCLRKWMMQSEKLWLCQNWTPLQVMHVRVGDIFEASRKFRPKFRCWALHCYAIPTTCWHLWRARNRSFMFREHRPPRSVVYEII